MATKKPKIVFTVECEFSPKELVEMLGNDEIEKADLIGEVMTVKSGVYENLLMGWITAVSIETNTKNKKK